MAFSLAELTKPLTRAEVQDSILSVAAALGLPTTSWKPTSVVRSIVRASAAVIAAFTSVTSDIAKQGFLDDAEGDWLTLLAQKTFNTVRNPATHARGTVVINNTGGAIFNFDPGDLVVANPANGQTYRNVDAVSIIALQTGVQVVVEAIEAGSGGTAAPGTITAFETAATGLTVTNEFALVGIDAEEDPPLRARARQKQASLSPNGPADAYDFVARSATLADGGAIGVTRTRVARTTNAVTVVCATAAGALTGDQLTAVTSAIQKQVVPLCIAATVSSAVPFVLNVTATVWIYTTANLSDTEVQALVRAALVAWAARQPIGGNVIPPDAGKLFNDDMRAAISDASPFIFRATIAVPVADTTIAINEVPTIGTTTITVLQVAP